MKSDLRKLAKGSILRVFTFSVNVIVTFFMMPFIIHSLGDRMYGLWMIIGSCLGFYWLFDLGMGSAIQRYVSRAIAKNAYSEANKIVNTSLLLFSLLGLFVILSSLLIAFTAQFFTDNIADIQLFRQIVIILGLSFAFRLPMRVFSSVLMAHLRYDLNTISRLTRLLVKTILVVIFLKGGYGILALAYITFFCDILEYILTFIFTRASAKYIVFSKENVDRSRIKPLFKYSVITFIAQIIDILRFSIDNFIVAAFLGLQLVTVYSIAIRLIKYFMDLMTSAVGIMLPVFSQYESKKDYDSIRRNFLFVTKISGYISILVGGVLLILGQPFIIRWLGKGYSGAYQTLFILLIPVVLMYIHGPVVGLLRGISKHGIHAVANVFEGFAHIVIGLLLVRKYGIIGVAIGTAIPLLIVRSVILPVYTCRIINLNFFDYYINTIAPVLIKSILTGTVLWLLLRGMISTDYTRLFVVATSYTVLYTLVVYFVGFSKAERELIRKSTIKK